MKKGTGSESLNEFLASIGGREAPVPFFIALLGRTVGESPLDSLARSTTPLAGASDGYWAESRRPLVSLVFVTPLLVLYEGGVLLLGPGTLRNGADVWLRQLLDGIGFGHYFLLPALTVGLLLAWHHLTHQPWRVSSPVLVGMACECGVLAVALTWAGQFIARLLPLPVHAILIAAAPAGIFGRLIGFCGAGFYEEVLFRLLLLPAADAVFRGLGAKPLAGAIYAIAATSLVFAAAHYVGAHGDPWDLSTFVFRFFAGAFFAGLFAARGFGVAAGTHAVYDIFVGLFQ